MTRRASGLALLIVVAALGGCDHPTAGPVDPGVPEAMTVYGCEITPSCSGNLDPAPDSAGYWMGSTVTPAACFSPSGAGINDVDRDGMHDICEHYLAERFRPALIFSRYDCDPRGEPYWAAKYFPSQGNTVRVVWALGYYRDCGAPQATLGDQLECTAQIVFGTLLTFNGLLPPYSIGPLPINNEDLCEGHNGDSEFLIADLNYDFETQHWVLTRQFFSAHWGTGGDHSRWTGTAGLEYPEKYGGYAQAWVADGKHASYPSRAACNNDGGLADTCINNPATGSSRVRHSRFYNLGSARANLMNQGSCVAGGALYSVYPELYGQECFWVPGRTFQGWELYRLSESYQERTSTPYYTVLVGAFECYGRKFGTCLDWGVNR